jgi:hypothetical protein
MLSDQAINEYRELCQKHFGVSLTLEEARGQAEQFLELCKEVAVPTNHKHETRQDHATTSQQ